MFTQEHALLAERALRGELEPIHQWANSELHPSLTMEWLLHKAKTDPTVSELPLAVQLEVILTETKTSGDINDTLFKTWFRLYWIARAIFHFGWGTHTTTESEVQYRKELVRMFKSTIDGTDHLGAAATILTAYQFVDSGHTVDFVEEANEPRPDLRIVKEVNHAYVECTGMTTKRNDYSEIRQRIGTMVSEKKKKFKNCKGIILLDMSKSSQDPACEGQGDLGYEIIKQFYETRSWDSKSIPYTEIYHAYKDSDFWKRPQNLRRIPHLLMFELHQAFTEFSGLRGVAWSTPQDVTSRPGGSIDPARTTCVPLTGAEFDPGEDSFGVSYRVDVVLDISHQWMIGPWAHRVFLVDLENGDIPMPWW